MAVAVRGTSRQTTPSRRQIFALSAALTVTMLTGTAAIAGLTRSAPPAPTAPRAGQVITPATPTVMHRIEPGG